MTVNRLNSKKVTSKSYNAFKVKRIELSNLKQARQNKDLTSVPNALQSVFVRSGVGSACPKPDLQAI